MSDTKQEAYNIIGQIRCVSAEDMGDGTMKVVFDYDKKFKDEYKRLFNLKRFSKKHFEQQLEQAIKHFAEKIELETGLRELREDVIKTLED